MCHRRESFFVPLCGGLLFQQDFRCGLPTVHYCYFWCFFARRTLRLHKTRAFWRLPEFCCVYVTPPAPFPHLFPSPKSPPRHPRFKFPPTPSFSLNLVSTSGVLVPGPGHHSFVPPSLPPSRPHPCSSGFWFAEPYPPSSPRTAVLFLQDWAAGLGCFPSQKVYPPPPHPFVSPRRSTQPVLQNGAGLFYLLVRSVCVYHGILRVAGVVGRSLHTVS